MMKRLLKKITLGFALSVGMLSYGQIGLTFNDPGTIGMTTSGVLSGGTISLTVTNIPENLTNTFNLRIYKKADDIAAGYNSGEFVSQIKLISLDSNKAYKFRFKCC